MRRREQRRKGAEHRTTSTEQTASGKEQRTTSRGSRGIRCKQRTENAEFGFASLLRGNLIQLTMALGNLQSEARCTRRRFYGRARPFETTALDLVGDVLGEEVREHPEQRQPRNTIGG